jgi:hypothetical protein
MTRAPGSPERVPISRGTRRYGGPVGVSCKRVGCRVPASTSLLIDARHSTVTLVDVELAPAGVTLCAVHVASVTAPVNWTLVDARDPQARLLVVDDVPVEPAPRSRSRARGDATHEPTLPYDDLSSEEPFPWRHHFTDDEPETLHASSPLLSRAFRAAV